MLKEVPLVVGSTTKGCLLYTEAEIYDMWAKYYDPYGYPILYGLIR